MHALSGTSNSSECPGRRGSGQEMSSFLNQLANIDPFSLQREVRTRDTRGIMTHGTDMRIAWRFRKGSLSSMWVCDEVDTHRVNRACLNGITTDYIIATPGPWLRVESELG